MRTDPAFLVLRGNFTQRQFDTLGQIWDTLQRGNQPNYTLPLFQIAKEGNIGLVKYSSSTGELSMESLFDNCNCSHKED